MKKDPWPYLATAACGAAAWIAIAAAWIGAWIRPRVAGSPSARNQE